MNLIKSFALLLFVLFYQSVSSQVRLSGIVINQADKKPIANANVYINNSTVGASTNEKGEFELLSQSSLNELVITHVGFQKETLIIRNDPGKLTIGLKVKPDLLENVTVKVNNKETWKKWGKLFNEYFLGQIGFAKQCTILNPEVIHFRFIKETQTVIAIAREPLLVDNKALGFLLHFDLDTFFYSFKKNTIYYSGTNHVEFLQPKNADQAKEFATNRLFAYRGSNMHFARSLFRDEFDKEGFRLYIFKSTVNSEKIRIRQLMKQTEERNYERGSFVKSTEVSDLSANKDSIRYYSDVMITPDYLFEDSIRIQVERQSPDKRDVQVIPLPKDTLLVSFSDNGKKLFQKNNKFLKQYETLMRDSEFPYDFFEVNNEPDKKFTMIYLERGNALTIEKNGLIHKDALLIQDGFMAQKRIAYLLPWEYDPASDIKLVNE